VSKRSHRRKPDELPRYEFKKHWPAEWARIRSNKRGWVIAGVWFLGFAALPFLEVSQWAIRAYGGAGMLLIARFLPRPTQRYSYSRTFLAVSMVVALAIFVVIALVAVALFALAGEI
jgi:hypothetical protein